MRIGTFGHHHFQMFGRRWPSDQHTLAYIGHSEDVPIGYINGGPISAKQARQNVVDLCEDDYGPIIQLALAPHDGTNGIDHGHVVFFDELPTCHTTINADMVVVPKTAEPFTIGTFLGDCACIIVANDEYITYMHCGTPELFAGMLERMVRQVEGSRNKDESDAFLGACISKKNYIYPADQVPERYKEFIIECQQGDQPFDKGTSFDLRSAIGAELKKINFNRLSHSWIDPFTENLRGDHSWASARYARYAKDCLGIGDGLSKRDLALYSFHCK